MFIRGLFIPSYSMLAVGYSMLAVGMLAQLVFQSLLSLLSPFCKLLTKQIGSIYERILNQMF